MNECIYINNGPNYSSSTVIIAKNLVLTNN